MELASTVRGIRHAPRPDFNRFREIKNRLAQDVGPEAAALAIAEMTGNQPGEVLRLPLAGVQDLARELDTYEEVVAPRNLRLPAVSVFGEETAGGADVKTRSVFRCVLDDAVVSSKSNFVLADGKALLDYQDDERELMPLDVEIDPIVFASTEDDVTVLVEAGGTVEPRLDDAISLAGVTTSNYWHWLFEFLPRVLVWRDQPGFGSVPLIIDEQMPAQFVEGLRLFAGRDGPIHTLKPGEAIRVRRLWTSSMFINVPHWPKLEALTGEELTVLDAPALAAQLEKLRPGLGELEPRDTPKRLFLSRESSLRSLANAPEVEGWFATRGFEVLDIGTRPFLEQVALVRGADLIAGSNGAALANLLFAQPGTRVAVLDNSDLEDSNWLAAVCDALGQRVSFLRGKNVGEGPQHSWNSNFRIDVEALPGFLDALLT